MNPQNILKNYWVSLLLIVFGGVLEYLTFNTTLVPIWAIGIIIIVMGVLQFIDKATSNKEFSIAVSTLQSQFTSDVGELKKQSEDQKRTSDEQIKLIKEMTQKMGEQQKARVNLVAKLVDKGLISQADVAKHLEGTDAFILYCYANPAPVSNKVRLTRLYPAFLQKVGFVRMGRRSSFFITTTNRLTKKLQNPNFLKQWLYKELRGQLEAEWEGQLSKLSDRQKEFLYKRYGEGDYSKFLNMNILIFKAKLSGGNIGIIGKNMLPVDFTKLIGTDIKLGKIPMEEEKKVQVRKFVFDSSFFLFFGEIPQDDLKKLLNLESKLKQQLNINSLLDYTQCSVDDIKKVFQSSFDVSKATEYANLVKSKAKEYEDALKEMGISTAS